MGSSRKLSLDRVATARRSDTAMRANDPDELPRLETYDASPADTSSKTKRLAAVSSIRLVGRVLIVHWSRRVRRLCQPQSQMHQIGIREPSAPIDRQSRRVISSSLHVNRADSVDCAIVPNFFHRCLA